jgi:hypothetical protein
MTLAIRWQYTHFQTKPKLGAVVEKQPDGCMNSFAAGALIVTVSEEEYPASSGACTKQRISHPQKPKG